MIHFLLTYSRTEAKIIDLEQFTDGAAAARAYVEAERRHLRDENYEIVLLGADSLDALRTTHSHYFDGDTEATSPYLAGI
jgi:hypothetical protein